MNEPIVLSDIQKQVLYGALLGDGCLTKDGRDTQNAYFTYTSKVYNHIKYIYDYFSEYVTKRGIVYFKYFDKRTQKEYSRYYFRTSMNPYFTDEMARWYGEYKRVIPNDLKLTSLTCLIWYIGDGCICNGNRSQHIKISTHAFCKCDIDNVLIPQLSDFEAKVMHDEGDKYFIYIPHHKMKEFFGYIGECPFEEYSYKWNYKEYKNFSIKICPNFEHDIINLFNKGCNPNQIAKKYSVDRSTVVKYLNKNGIDHRLNNFKRGDIYE